MTSVDLMGVAIDWLDAYRAGDLFIVDLYADDASLQCHCGGEKELRGTDAITAYWRHRLVENPAGDLIDLQWDGSDVVLDFRVPGGIVQAMLTFDADGSLLRSRCGPLQSGHPAPRLSA
jgi:hypothetical protein